MVAGKGGREGVGESQRSFPKKQGSNGSEGAVERNISGGVRLTLRGNLMLPVQVIEEEEEQQVVSAGEGREGKARRSHFQDHPEERMTELIE